MTPCRAGRSSLPGTGGEFRVGTGSVGTGAPCIGRRRTNWRLRGPGVAATWLTLFGAWLLFGIRTRTPISLGLCGNLLVNGCGAGFWGPGGDVGQCGRGVVGLAFGGGGFGRSVDRRPCDEISRRWCCPDGQSENWGEQTGGPCRFGKKCQGCSAGQMRGGGGNEIVAGGNRARCCRLSSGILRIKGNQPGGECG